MSSLAADELIDSSLQLLLRLARNSGVGESPKSHRKSAPRMSSVILSDDSLGVSQLRVAHSSAEIFSIQEEVSIPPLWTDTWVPGFDYDEAQTTTPEKTLLCAPCAPSEPHFAWSSGEKAMHVSINNPMPVIALRDPPPPSFLPAALKQRDACSLLTLPLCFTFTNYLPRSGDLQVRSAMRNALNARLGIDSENVTLRTPSAVSALPHSLLQGDFETNSTMAEDDYAFEDEIRASTSSRPSRAVSRPHATREYTDYMAQEDDEYEEPKQKQTKPKTSKKKKGDVKAITESGEIANIAEGDEINIGDDTSAPTKKKKRRVKRLDWMEERKPLPVPVRGKRSGDGNGDELIGDDEDGAMETMYMDDEEYPYPQPTNASQSASHSSNKQHQKKEDTSASATSGVDGKSSVQSLLQKSGTSGFPVEGRYKLYGRNSKRAGEEEPITDVPWSWEEKDGLLAIAAKLEKPLDWNAVRDMWNDIFRKDAEPLPEEEDEEDQEEPSQERRKSAAQILRQYTALSTTPSRSHKTKWSVKDDEKLMEMFDYTSTQKVANELGRSPKAIVERIFEKYSIDLLEGEYQKERYERIEEMEESPSENKPAWYTSKSTPLLQLLQQSREPVIHSTIASFKPKRGQPTSPSGSTPNPFSELDEGNEVDDQPQSKKSSAKKVEKKSRWRKERDDDSDEDFDISMVPTKPSGNKGKRSHPNASAGGKGGKKAKLVEAGDQEVIDISEEEEAEEKPR